MRANLSAGGGGISLSRPSAAVDAGWSLPGPEVDQGAPEIERAPEIDPPQRTPSVPPALDVRDPFGDDLFADLEAQELPRGIVTNVVGIKFRPASTIYEFDGGEAHYQRDERVMVESDRGPVVAIVAVGSRRRQVLDPLRRVLRLAGSGEARAKERNAEREREAYLFCKGRIRERNLPMKLVSCEYPLSASGRVIFYFASEERVDFRDLVRDLSQRLHARIELRQIGVRDEAKMVGGIGSCGRELCCSTWLPAFVPVSIKMAKDQGLVLNPSKVSGQCGRLKCCLVYEQDTYREMRKGLPKVGKRVMTPAGNAKVVELDVLRQRIRVWFDEGGSETFPADAVTLLAPPPVPGRGGRPTTPAADDPPDEDGDSEKEG